MTVAATKTSTLAASKTAIDPLLIPRPYRVVDKVAEVADITSLHVVPVNGGPLPSFRPAQVGMIGAFGVGVGLRGCSRGGIQGVNMNAVVVGNPRSGIRHALGHEHTAGDGPRGIQ